MSNKWWKRLWIFSTFLPCLKLWYDINSIDIYVIYTSSQFDFYRFFHFPFTSVTYLNKFYSRCKTKKDTLLFLSDMTTQSFHRHLHNWAFRITPLEIRTRVIFVVWWELELLCLSVYSKLWSFLREQYFLWNKPDINIES